LYACTVAASLALLAAPAPASLILALDLPAMAQRADAVAVVEVTSARAAWDSAHQRILSTIEVAVVESWKGSPAPATRITIRQPGGTVGDVTMVVSGMPRFSLGERALVFLQGPAERATVVGMAQGKRAIHRDPAGSGRWLVDPPERAGASYVGASVAAPEQWARRPLDEVRAQVRDLVARARAR